MKSRPLKIDWSLLEEAFSSHDEEPLYFLDLINGHIHMDDEDSQADDHADDEDYHYTEVEAIPTPSYANDKTRLAIQPPTTVVKIQWMHEFLPTIEEEFGEMATELREAIPGESPVEIRAVLNRHPDGRDRWYMFREIKVQEMIESWLKEHSVHVVDPPPWRNA